MSNLKRYCLCVKVGDSWDLAEPHEDPYGVYVKFDDIKELLPPANNTGSPKLPPYIDFHILCDEQGLSPEQSEILYRWIERQLQAGA